jgi:hypothetical protein
VYAGVLTLVFFGGVYQHRRPLPLTRVSNARRHMAVVVVGVRGVHAQVCPSNSIDHLLASLGDRESGGFFFVFFLVSCGNALNDM